MYARSSKEERSWKVLQTLLIMKLKLHSNNCYKSCSSRKQRPAKTLKRRGRARRFAFSSQLNSPLPADSSASRPIRSWRAQRGARPDVIIRGRTDSTGDMEPPWRPPEVGEEGPGDRREL
jgi:hypothetical protein